MSDAADILHPRANPTLLGHQAAEARMLAAEASGRLPHTWLISGRRGIGKATLAYRFARFLLNQPGGDLLFAAPADGLAVGEEDPLFRRIAAGGHPDLMTVELGFDEKKGRERREILVEDARAIAQFLHMTPAEGGWRIVILDSADEMNRNAANAILKVLEEPPARALLLLISHAPGQLLPTIRSRCCHLALPPLSDETLLTLLHRYSPDLDEEALQGLAVLSEGSIGRALALQASGGLELYKGLLALLTSLPELDLPAVHGLGDRLARGKDHRPYTTTMELLIWWLARLVRHRAKQQQPREIVAGEGALMKSLAERGHLAEWISLWEKVAHLLNRSESVNLDRKQVLINAFLELQALAARP